MNSSFDDATRAQIEAAKPDASTWLTANAGSGKTRVLTDRVARLLLEGPKGVDPQQILCLTYTKAAASEMQNRLFRRLGEWAMLDDATLRDALAQLGVESTLDPAKLRDARTLFARAIETPGGLKIQTIHSFCAAILRRFPLEAGVSPQFTEIEDRAAELLRAEIVDQMAEGTQGATVADLARHYTGEDFSSLTRGIVRMQDLFSTPLTRADILGVLGQPPNLSPQVIEKSVFRGGEVTLIRQMIPHLMAKGGNDASAGQKLEGFVSETLAALPLLEAVLLTGSTAKIPFGAKIGSFPTKATQQMLPHLMPDLDALMQRVEDAREPRLALLATERTMALEAFARPFLAQYDAAKQARGWLDFDDLILKTRALLSNPEVAAWVLYRLDGGIDHILVDEAQDTSPRQWDVIEKLADEFNSGAGSRPNVDRTLFVVGDKKQSIYSFQGADPEELDRKAKIFETKIKGARKLFQNRSLEYSFRSSSAILRMVDQAFDARLGHRLEKQTQHKTFKTDLPGRVDIWPLIEDTKDTDDRVWTDPVDRLGSRHHVVLLAEKIAKSIKELTDGTHYIPDDGEHRGTFIKRPIRPGDFLVLVQTRGPVFSQIIRACKALGLPIAGADRLKIGAELAVKDLAALLSFLATPDDSLSLAAALKSPLFGWSEQDLFRLAHYRKTDHIWQALRTQEAEHPLTLDILHDLRAQIDFMRPFDLIARILTRHDGRSNLLARLGPEAEDGINALLSQALAYERTEIPSLTGFLEWMQTDDLEIKRQVDASSDQIRVMSVHGAKGLESPIVILPDSGQKKNEIKDEIIDISGLPIWKSKADDMPKRMSERIDDMKDAQFRERMRLFYVAMTRAEKWLIIAAAGKVSKDGNDWYQIAETAMGHAGGTLLKGSDVRRLQEGDWHGLPIAGQVRRVAKIASLEPVFEKTVHVSPAQDETLSPSKLGGAKALPGEENLDEEDAKSYGSFVHQLLERFVGVPPERRPELTRIIGQQWDAMTQARALAEASDVLDADHLAHVFGPAALSEVPLSGSANYQKLHGSIDRLVIEGTKILAVDYKTNRIVPDDPDDCPEGLLRQMGAYAHILGQIYPDHQIETAILWTTTQQLMVLPHDIVTEAFWRTPHLDAVSAPT